MLTSYATGLLGISAVLVLWVAVQIAWRRSFPADGQDPDVLAGRPGCGGCDRTEICESSRAAPPREEE